MRHHYNVLVVDDDHAVCSLAREALAEFGISVDCATNDSAAYDRISRSPSLDGIVCDVSLGRGVTGYDVARFARTTIPNMAVVYVSGAAGPSSHAAFGVPNSIFLEKPFSMKAFIHGHP